MSTPDRGLWGTKPSLQRAGQKDSIRYIFTGACDAERPTLLTLIDEDQRPL